MLFLSDSLERELLGEEPSPLPRKDKMSLTNLSRDSGLTMSDTQLYTPDEEENESTSSGHSGGEKSNYSSGHGSEKSGSEPIRYHHPPGNPNALYASVTRKPAKQPQQQQQAEVGAHQGDFPPAAHHHKLTVSYSNPNCDMVDGAGPGNQMGGYSIYEEVDGAQGGAKSSAYNNPYFQRTDWTRKHAGLRKLGRAEQERQMQFQPGPHNMHTLGHLGPPPNRHSPLRRSASEESLLDKLRTSPDDESGRADSPSKRPALHRKGRAPMPPQTQSPPSGGAASQQQEAKGAMRFSPHIALQHRIVIENTGTGPAPAGAQATYFHHPHAAHHHVMHRSRSAHHLGADEEIEASRASSNYSGEYYTKKYCLCFLLRIL